MKSKRMFLLLLLLLLVTFTACGNEDNEKTPNKNDGAEEPSVEPIQKINALVEHIEYDNDKGYLEIAIKSSLPDETLVFLELTERNGDIVYTTEGYVEENKLIAKIEENDDVYIINDTYSLQGSVEVNDNKNPHLVDEYGDYENFYNRYESNEKVEESSDGYLITIISDEDIMIEDAYHELEVDELRRDKKRKTAKTPEYSDVLNENLSYEGEYVKYSGWIEQVVDFKEGEPDRLLVSLRIEDDFYDFIHNMSGDMISVVLPEDIHPNAFVGDESINVYGYVKGIYTYTNTRQKEKNVPNIILDDMELHYNEEEFEGNFYHY